MGDLLRLTKKAIKGHAFLFYFSFFLQFLMVLGVVFTSFMSKVLVDALLHNLDPATLDPVSKLVVNILSLGNGEEFIYSHMYVLPLSLLLGAIYIFLMSLVRMLSRFYVTNAMQKGIQVLLYNHLVSLPYSEYQNQKSGDLIQCCTRDVEVVRRFLGFDLNQLTYTVFMVGLCSGILASVSWKLFIIAIILFPFLFVYSFCLIKTVRKRYRATDDAEAVLMDTISNDLNAVRLVKAYAAENSECERFDREIGEYEARFISWRRLSSFFFASSDIFIFLSRTVAVIYALFLVFSKEITPGTAVIAYTFVNMMVWPLRNTAMRISALGQTLASSDRITLFLNRPEEDRLSGDKAPFGQLVFDDVSFAYPDQKEVDVIENVSFTLNPGETLAIMGKTGSGKSTVASLLMRLYEPTSGKITLDGKDISSMSKKSLRRHIAPVLQDPFLFSKTVSDNISIGMEMEDEETIEESAKLAKMEESIASFAEGYQTPVGDKGVTLSGGQRQRLALARALATKRDILLLDDSLSAVDSKTDLAIRKGLSESGRRKMTIIITHRVNTAKDADKIMVLDKGRVESLGTHEELLVSSKLYKEIATIQGVFGEGVK